jgi:hypothetical protein
VTYFADENALGFAKLLLRQRNDIVHPGHELVPEIPLGSPDLDWLPIVGRMQWIVLSRDRRIRSRPAELKLYREHGVRSVWIGGKTDRSSRDLVEIFLANEDRLTRYAIKMGPGPWAAAMTTTGVRPINIKTA